MILIISCSINKESYSLSLASYASEAIRSRGAFCELCDLSKVYSEKNFVEQVVAKLQKAKALVIVTPCFPFGVASGLARLMEESFFSYRESYRKAWRHKLLGIISVAEDPSCERAAMDFFLDMMVRGGCFLAPYPVLAVRDSFVHKQNLEKVTKMIEKQCAHLVSIISPEAKA